MIDRTILDRVLFIGGNLRMPSVRMRCQQVADLLGVPWTTPNKPGARPWHAGNVPEADLAGRDLFVLVKSTIDRRSLFERGRIVWDVIDAMPPYDCVDAYLTQTRHAAKLLGPYRVPVFTVAQHHCNWNGTPTVPDPARGRLVWIGATEWLPQDLEGQGVEIHIAGASGVEHIRTLYERADVLVNARRFDRNSASTYYLHTALNSGTKVINAVGFGLPSVTEWEPWVDEIAPGCTVQCSPGEGADTARRLLRDGARYQALRECCLETAETYSLSSIGAAYQRVLEQVASLPRR